jgi:hypothetical protein
MLTSHNPPTGHSGETYYGSGLRPVYEIRNSFVPGYQGMAPFSSSGFSRARTVLSFIHARFCLFEDFLALWPSFRLCGALLVSSDPTKRL